MSDQCSAPRGGDVKPCLDLRYELHGTEVPATGPGLTSALGTEGLCDLVEI